MFDDIPGRSRKNKLQMWTLIWGIDKKRARNHRSFTTLKSNNEKAEKAAENLADVELHLEKSLDSLLEKLDTTFQSENMEDAINI